MAKKTLAERKKIHLTRKVKALTEKLTRPEVTADPAKLAATQARLDVTVAKLNNLGGG